MQPVKHSNIDKTASRDSINMEVAFHSNKCALKDSLRIIRIGKNPCWKRRRDLFSYSEGLIAANKNIVALNTGISDYAQSEFKELEQMFIGLSNTKTSTEEDKCSVCLKNCLEDLKEEELRILSDEEIMAHRSTREEQIAEVADRMGRLNNKTEYIESVINMQNEELERITYNSAAEYTESHLRELEETIRRKKRALFIKRWLSGLIVFFCFLSLLLLKPFVPYA